MQRNDPRFPNRPDHPDFWKMSTAVIEHDTAVDSGTPPQQVVRQYVDEASLLYMAKERFKRFNAPPQHLLTSEEVLALYVDAFIAGYRVAQLKAEEKKT